MTKYVNVEFIVRGFDENIIKRIAGSLTPGTSDNVRLKQQIEKYVSTGVWNGDLFISPNLVICARILGYDQDYEQ